MSMFSEDLVSRTSYYRITDFSPTQSSDLYPGADLATTSSDLSRVPGYGSIWSRPDGPITQNRPPSRRRGQPMHSMYSIDDDNMLFLHGRGNDRISPDEGCNNGPFSTSNHLPPTRPSTPLPRFDVTASCEDITDDEEETSSPAILLDRHRRRQGMDSSSSEEDGTETPTSSTMRPRSTPRNFVWMDAASLGFLSPSLIGEKLEPHAKFFIQRKKHAVSIKFEPAV